MHVWQFLLLYQHYSLNIFFQMYAQFMITCICNIPGQHTIQKNYYFFFQSRKLPSANNALKQCMRKECGISNKVINNNFYKSSLYDATCCSQCFTKLQVLFSDFRQCIFIKHRFIWIFLFYLPHVMVEIILLLGETFEMEILMNLHVMRSLNQKSYSQSLVCMCVCLSQGLESRDTESREPGIPQSLRVRDLFGQIPGFPGLPFF